MDEVNCLEMKSVPIKSTKLSERTARDDPAMTGDRRQRCSELIKALHVDKGNRPFEPSCLLQKTREKKASNGFKFKKNSINTEGETTQKSGRLLQKGNSTCYSSPVFNTEPRRHKINNGYSKTPRIQMQNHSQNTI